MFFGIANVVQSEETLEHRAAVRTTARTNIVSPESGVKLERAMLSMKRHPDGSIHLRVQTQPVLFRSTDPGQSWTRIDVKLPNNLEKPFLNELGISRDGSVWLMHQSNGTGE